MATPSDTDAQLRGNLSEHNLLHDWQFPGELVDLAFEPGPEFSRPTGQPLSLTSSSTSTRRLSRISRGPTDRTNAVDHANLSSSNTCDTEGDISSPSASVTASRSISPQWWNPVWLTTLVLTIFSITAVVFFIVVLVLYLYSRAHSGLGQASESLHYVWTYVPTAAFILTTSLWSRVDFYCKELTPWQNLKNGPAPADRSICLDYIDPILPINIWLATKFRHWPVLLSILISLLLRLCVVLSAGLVFLVPTQITRNIDAMAITSVFNAEAFDPAVVRADPVDAFYGAKAKGTSWNYGTTENVTVQTFDDKSIKDVSNTRLRAKVSGFRMNMDCEEAEIGITTLARCPWKAVLQSCLIANISGSNCHLNDVIIGQTSPHMYFTANGRTSNFQGLFDSYICNSNFSYVQIDNYQVYPPNATSPDDYRFLFTMSEVHWDIMPDDGTSSRGTNWSIAQTTGVICKPSYSIDKYDVTLSPSSRTIQEIVLLPNTSSSLPGLELKTLINGTLLAQESTTFGQGGEDAITGLIPVPSMFQILAGLNNNSRQAAFMDNDLLMRLSSQTMTGVGAQLAYKYLMQDGTDTISGAVTETQQRLRVSGLTTILLLITLGLLVVAMPAMIWIRPQDSVPCATASLASSAAILAASTGFREHLKNQVTGVAITASALDHQHYQSVVDDEGRFSIQFVAQEPETDAIKPPSKKWWRRKRNGQKKKEYLWWKPMPTRKWFIAIILLLPLMLIASLEALQQMSDRNNGVIKINTWNDYNIAIAYIPISVMLLITSMYNSLDSTLSILAPYFPLRRGNAPASRSILTSLVSKPLPYTMYLAIMGRHWAVVSAVSASLIASFLTIVTSGLYSPVLTRAQHNIQMQQIDILNLSHVDTTVYDNLAGTTTKLTMLHGLGYPTWTYEDLVIPAFEAIIPETLFGNNNTFDDIVITLRTPALRPSLRCNPVSPNQISHTGDYFWKWEIASMTDGSSVAVLPTPGINSEIGANLTLTLGNKNITARWQELFILPNNTESEVQTLQIGFASSVFWGLSNGSARGRSTAPSRKYVSDVDPSLPNFVIAAGLGSATKTDKVVKVERRQNNSFWDVQFDGVIAFCFQVLEVVDTDVTLNWPNMTTSLAYPPVPNEQTARPISNQNTTSSAWFKPANDSLGNTTDWFGVSMNTFMWTLQEDTDTAQTLNAWFSTLENMPDGRPLSELLGKSNQDNLLAASSKLYSRYAAQAINANMRSTSPQPGQNLARYNATISSPALRLRQNKGPKIVLQVLFGIMVLCAATAYLLVDTKHLARQSPGSIVGRMELFVWSEMCSSETVIPKGSEWWTDREWKERGLFEAWKFSLGWWDNEDTRWYGVDVGKAGKAM